MDRKKAFTLIELLVVISIIAIMIGILMPALGNARRNAQRMESNTRIRGIHQGCVQYADGNRQAFPGMGADNLPMPIAASSRYQRLLAANVFAPQYMISPMEASKPAWTSGTVTTQNFSFAMLRITSGAAGVNRNNEWGANNGTSEAAMLADRSMTIDTAMTTASLFTTSANPLAWHGAVVWNDNHVTDEQSPTGLRTRYGNSSPDSNDDLFADPNAMMAYD